LVGRNSHAIAGVIAGDKSIHITDAVDDTLPLIAQAQVCVAPILSGSGTRFKILEAWAAKRAVVSTVLGAEGLGAKHGEQLLLAERAETFSVSILNCLESPAVRTRLGEKGYALYKERYSWPAAWKALEQAGI
jgi:glycosyltransferase involved in cell wall biosynthesis